MESQEGHYIAFPLNESTSGLITDEDVNDRKICESECVLQGEFTVNDLNNSNLGVTVEILTEKSDEEDSLVYPIYIKEEDQHQSISGDDESMAVEALRQLGGYSNETKKIKCSKCSLEIFQVELVKHQQICSAELCCSTCGEKFERKIDLANHIVCHQVDRPHACRICGNLFRSKNDLQSHVNQQHQLHSAERSYKCNICGTNFQRPSSLSNHMKVHTYIAGRALVQSQDDNQTLDPGQIVSTYDVGQIQFAIPTYTFQNDQSETDNQADNLQGFTVITNGDYGSNVINNQYNLDVNSFSSESILKVSTVSFDGKKSLENRNLNGVKSRWNECEFCDKQFETANLLSSHQLNCPKKLKSTEKNGTGKWGKHACSECGKKFTTKQKMFRHQWIHRKKTQSCEVCGNQYESREELDSHRLSEHPQDSPFTCGECGKSFVSRQGLWEHGRTHAGSPAHFHCDTCSKTFSSRQGYLIHHRTHTGERPYGCKYCYKAFRDGGTLRKHERIHTGERPHVCPLCSRAFNQKVVLREHVRWVHAAGKNETESTGPPFLCPLCGIETQDRDELCAHIVKHSDKMIADAKMKTANPKAKPKSKVVKNKVVNTEDTLVLVADTHVSDVGESNEITFDKKSNAMFLTDDQNSVIESDQLRQISNSLFFGTKDCDKTESQENFEQVNNSSDVKIEIEMLVDEKSDQKDCLYLDESSHSSFVQDDKFHDDDENEYDELICGICGDDDFSNKYVLMEHVKCHI